MLTQKDKDFIAGLKVPNWSKSDQFFVMWSRIKDYVTINYDGCPMDKLNEMVQAAQIRFGKEEMERRKNGKE